MKQQQYLLDTCICISAITTIPIASIIDRYADEKARLMLMGKPTGEFDLLIGCTAVAKKMIMVTENVEDFKIRFSLKNI